MTDGPPSPLPAPVRALLTSLLLLVAGLALQPVPAAAQQVQSPAEFFGHEMGPATYASGEILQSGWLLGGDKIADRAAVATVGHGDVKPAGMAAR